MSRKKTKKGDEPAGTGDTDARSGDKAAAAPEEPAAEPHDGAPTDATLADRLLRLQADFDNYRKRTLREREQERLRANEDLMLELIPILDHLEMGLKTAAEHEVEPTVIQGFRIVYDQVQGALRKFGLEPIDAEGEPFDPHRHESVAMAPSEDAPRDHVLTQIRRGYRLGTQLLRPAQIVLSLGPAETREAGPPGSAVAGSGGDTE